MRILVDADGCPVKEEIITVAKDSQIEVLLVTTTDHYSDGKEQSNLVRTIYVDPGQDSVDYHLLSIKQKGDLFVTQDYGLASLLLPKFRVLHHSGMEYHSNNINHLLTQRFESQQLRKAGKSIKGPSKFTQSDRKLFKKRLIKIISEHEQKISNK